MRKQKTDRVMTAACEVWSHQFGWELRLQIDGRGLQMSSVVRSPEAITETAEKWRAAMIASGWFIGCGCRGGWACEDHPEQSFGHDCCGGAGTLCRNPGCADGQMLRAE